MKGAFQNEAIFNFLSIQKEFVRTAFPLLQPNNKLYNYFRISLKEQDLKKNLSTHTVKNRFQIVIIVYIQGFSRQYLF